MTSLDPNFWQKHFEDQHTPWDRGACSPQLQQWLELGTMKRGRTCVPGCGGGWEVLELARHGFETVGIDYTPAAVEKTKDLLGKNHAVAEVIEADVLEFQPHQRFDNIYEQTCLCAIHPDHWIRYSEQLSRWLKPGGSLFILFMQVSRPNLKDGAIVGPPFHCDINAMRALFNGNVWMWPSEPLARVEHPSGWAELACCLKKIG